VTRPRGSHGRNRDNFSRISGSNIVTSPDLTSNQTDTVCGILRITGDAGVASLRGYVRIFAFASRQKFPFFFLVLCFRILSSSRFT
jgi:hypothetical protein